MATVLRYYFSFKHVFSTRFKHSKEYKIQAFKIFQYKGLINWQLHRGPDFQNISHESVGSTASPHLRSQVRSQTIMKWHSRVYCYYQCSFKLHLSCCLLKCTSSPHSHPTCLQQCRKSGCTGTSMCTVHACASKLCALVSTQLTLTCHAHGTARTGEKGGGMQNPTSLGNVGPHSRVLLNEMIHDHNTSTLN